MTIDTALSICSERSLTRAEVVLLCEATAEETDEALEALAQDVAERYLRGAATFLSADTLMNDLFSYAAIHSELPPKFMRVYEAFDEGEYRHAGDEEGVDSEVKYTRAMLLALIAEGMLPDKSLERTGER
jgi:hypothetical protein